MKKTDGYVMRKLEEEYLLLPTGKRAEEVNEVISLSETAAFIYQHAEEASSIAKLAELVGREYGIEAAEVMGDVKAVVKTLEKKGVLVQASKEGSETETQRAEREHTKPQ